MEKTFDIPIARIKGIEIASTPPGGTKTEIVVIGCDVPLHPLSTSGAAILTITLHTTEGDVNTNVTAPSSKLQAFAIPRVVADEMLLASLGK